MPENLRPQDGDMTIDLTLDACDDIGDLQALADEIAETSSEEDAMNAPGEEGMLDERVLTEAQARIQELEKSETEWTDKYQRLLADFANFRNRTTRDTQLAVDLSEKKLLMEILPVLDSFERCLESRYQSIEDYHAGVSLIQKQFISALRRIGVEKVELRPGDAFDAQNMEALTTACNPSLPDGAVAEIFEQGFLLRDALLRPARVVVNHARPSHKDGSEDLS